MNENGKKRVLVTGGSRGIGAAVAMRLAQKGYVVAINYNSSESRAMEVLSSIKEAGKEGYLIKFDISDRNQTTKMLTEDLEKRGRLWGVVCNAGIAMDSPFPVLEDDMWDKVINTNLNGFYNVVKPLVMSMVEGRSGGRIVALSSISGITGNRGQVNYAASKAGIIGAAKSLSLELARRNVCVNVVAPGLIETEMVEGLPKQDIIKMIPMRRYGKADEVAALIEFLMGEEAGYITGQVVSINGGMI